jgi:2-polyprenyl-6-hydroxyphenyl methylase/3-demethylubiquinone-9 3-methyltransferase
MTNTVFYPTLNQEEVNQFDQIADQWWDEGGPFKPLHQLNPCRLGFIKDHMMSHFELTASSTQPLRGLKILDIGCGGGILCEPLARLGATVTGIDASPNAIQAAQQHALQMGLDITYYQTTVESVTDKTFDVVCALEIIEHVDQPEEFIKSCARLLSRQGLFFVSTLNKTLKSYLQGIVVAEYILRWVPKGTHDWQKFISPAQVATWLRESNLSFIDLKGFHYNPFNFFSVHQPLWSLSQSLKVNYIGCAKF